MSAKTHHIKIGFSKSSKRFPIFSWLIRWFQKTPFSHVYLRYVKDDERQFIYQASGAAVNFMGLKLFNKSNIVIKEFDFEIPKEVWQEILWGTLIEYSNLPYGKKQIIAIVLAECFNKRFSRLEDGEYAFICSEIVVEILDAAGIVVRDEWGKSVDLVTPKDIYEKLRNLK